MTPFYTILTNYGKTSLAEALAAQQPLKIPHMAVGDGGGEYYEPTETQTNLRNERWRGDLNDLRTDDELQGQVIAEAIIPHDIEDGDWTAREIGLFDVKGGLIAVGKYPETYIPPVLSGAKSQVYINIIIKVDNVAAVELIVNHDTVIASKDYVNRSIDRLKGELQKRFKKILFASDFGAIDGANNTLAFQKLALACNAEKSHFKVIFDVSNSEIFDERVNPTPNENTRYYQSIGDIFSLKDCSDFILDFTGCEMVTKRGLHYGSFHPLTGAKYDAVGNFTNAAYAAELGVVLSLDNCKNYTCLNFNANGNNGHLIVGGKWGDTGIQLKHIGIREFNCSNAIWQNRTCNHFALDGTYIGGNSSIDVGGITVINEVCEYNGRQGFSFTGGKGIVFINPRWCYTGMGVIYSSPGAGIDIEPNAGFSTKSLKIINPCIVGNRGAGVLGLGVSDEQTTNIVISGGEIVSTSPGAAFYVNTPKVRMNIHDTDIHGSIRAANAKLTFRDCFISTLMKYNIQPSGTVMENIGKEVKFVNCKILTTYLDALYITNGLFDSCDIEFAVDSPLVRSRAAVIGGNAVIKDTHISANYTNYPTNINDIGERTFIDTTGSKLGTNWIGATKISGHGLAVDSRAGNTNVILGSINPDGTYLYNAGSSITLTSVSNGNGAFTTDIPLGTGMFMITIHSFSSYPRLSFCVNQLSFPSNEQHAHGTAILSKTTANANITSSMIAIVDGLDVLRLTGVSDMTGVTCVISKLATSNLAGFTMVK